MTHICFWTIALIKIILFKKSCTQETQNLLTNADSSNDIFVSAGVQKGADGIFIPPPKKK